MIYLQVAAAVAAVLIAAGPSLSTVWTKVLERVWEPQGEPALKPVGPNYQAAMQHLASVRLRLVRTGGLTKESSEAIETLTLALIEGSDQ
jgi:hypothetical protein